VGLPPRVLGALGACQPGAGLNCLSHSPDQRGQEPQEECGVSPVPAEKLCARLN
jgi:hypothetical protein